MAERLTVSLEDGRLTQLRELAGGERKVGAYLSQVVAWLWDSKEELDAVGLSGCMLMPADKVRGFLDDNGGAMRQKMDAIDARLNMLEAELKARHAEIAEIEAAATRRSLATQEDSSSNDA